MPLLLAAGETLVDVALSEGPVHLQAGHCFLYFANPGAKFRRLASDGGGGCAKEVGYRYARHLDGVLHRQKQAGTRPLVDVHVQNILTIEGDGPLRHGVLRVPRDDVRQRRLPRTIRAHHRLGATGLNGQVDAFEDGGLSRIRDDACVQVADLKCAHV